MGNLFETIVVPKRIWRVSSPFNHCPDRRAHAQKDGDRDGYSERRQDYQNDGGEVARRGIPKEAFSRLQAPIVLKIGAETPEEIAISIAVEIIAAKKRKLDGFKKGE
jgi:hypothetical protein